MARSDILRQNSYILRELGITGERQQQLRTEGAFRDYLGLDSWQASQLRDMAGMLASYEKSPDATTKGIERLHSVLEAYVNEPYKITDATTDKFRQAVQDGGVVKDDNSAMHGMWHDELDYDDSDLFDYGIYE